MKFSNISITDSDGQVIACNSACTQFSTDECCCTESYGSSETCKPKDYSSFFKSRCSYAYSYAFDNPTSMFSCENTI